MMYDFTDEMLRSMMHEDEWGVQVTEQSDLVGREVYIINRRSRALKIATVLQNDLIDGVPSNEVVFSLDGREVTSADWRIFDIKSLDKGEGEST